MKRLKYVAAGVWTTAIIVVAGASIVRIVSSQQQISAPPGVLKSGHHVVFVVFVSTGLPDDEFVDSVKRARDAVQEFAETCGHTFSSVGVANSRHLTHGLLLLERLGPFHELSVGRSWFNSATKRYTKDMGGAARLPQVLAVLDSIEVSDHDWTLVRQIELGRFSGSGELDEWERLGYPITAAAGRQVFPEAANAGNEISSRWRCQSQ